MNGNMRRARRPKDTYLRRFGGSLAELADYLKIDKSDPVAMNALREWILRLPRRTAASHK